MQYMWKYCMTMKVKIWKGWQPVHKVCAACLNSDKNGFGLWCTLWIRYPPSKGQKVKHSIHVVRNLSIWKWFSILGSSIFWAFTFKVDAHIFSRIEIMGSLSKIAENVPNLTNLEARRPFEVSCFEFLMNLSLVQLKLRYQKENFMFCLLAADIFEYLHLWQEFGWFCETQPWMRCFWRCYANISCKQTLTHNIHCFFHNLKSQL